MEDPIKKPFPHNILREDKDEEFTWWYERVFLQSPNLSSLKYDDEKMWEAWKTGYKLGLAQSKKLDDSLRS